MNQLNQYELSVASLKFATSGAARAPKPDTEPQTGGGDAKAAQAAVGQGQLRNT